ncbi:MAG: RagB/SusD family nutrient uptake outer membrane protein [Rikenellaceae bacterium]|nr:RagB/SusD family nutrient uptake outer membrane protein [Rikenellaceae bacterium]
MDMLKNVKILFVALTALCAVSCLDKVPQSAIPQQQAMQTFDDAEQTVTGIYSLLKSSALYSGYLTILPDLQTDLVYAVDGYSNTYGNFWLWTIRSTTSEIESVYASLYQIIASCNFYLDYVPRVVAATTDENKLNDLNTYTGEVYAIRALAYSELLKCYCKAYKPETAERELGVVLRTTTLDKQPLPRASLYDSYQQVIKDLERAEELLDEDNDAYSSAFVTRAMVLALHARVALYMEDWQSAVKYSTELIESRNFALSSAVSYYTNNMTYFDYMWNYDVATEIIWRIGFTTTSYGGALGQSFLGFNVDYTYYYPDYVPAQWVLDLYSNSDMRYSSYFYTLPTGYNHGLQWPLLVKYFGNQDFINNALIYHTVMPKPFRLAEQYLIRAEALCRQQTPNFSAATKDINTLRASRIVSGGGVNLTADNYIEQIAAERVRELYMEGFRLHDFKRWGELYRGGEGFTRTPQSNSLTEGSSLSVKADDPLFVWPIPIHEIEAPGSLVQPNESN